MYNNKILNLKFLCTYCFSCVAFLVYVIWLVNDYSILHVQE